MNVSKKEHLLTQHEPPKLSRLLNRALFVLLALFLFIFVFSLLDTGQIGEGFEAFHHWRNTRDYWRFIDWFGNAFWIFLLPGWLLSTVLLVGLHEVIQKIKKD